MCRPNICNIKWYIFANSVCAHHFHAAIFCIAICPFLRIISWNLTTQCLVVILTQYYIMTSAVFKARSACSCQWAAYLASGCEWTQIFEQNLNEF